MLGTAKDPVIERRDKIIKAYLDNPKATIYDLSKKLGKKNFNPKSVSTTLRWAKHNGLIPKEEAKIRKPSIGIDGMLVTDENNKVWVLTPYHEAKKSG